MWGKHKLWQKAEGYRGKLTSSLELSFIPHKQHTRSSNSSSYTHNAQTHTYSQAGLPHVVTNPLLFLLLTIQITINEGKTAQEELLLDQKNIKTLYDSQLLCHYESHILTWLQLVLASARLVCWKLQVYSYRNLHNRGNLCKTEFWRCSDIKYHHYANNIRL